MKKTNKYRDQPYFNNFSDFDQCDLLIQKITIQLFKELVDREIPVEKIAITKMKNCFYDVKGRKISVVQVDGKVLVKVGSGAVDWIEWIYDILVQ